MLDLDVYTKSMKPDHKKLIVDMRQNLHRKISYIHPASLAVDELPHAEYGPYVSTARNGYDEVYNDKLKGYTVEYHGEVSPCVLTDESARQFLNVRMNEVIRFVRRENVKDKFARNGLQQAYDQFAGIDRYQLLNMEQEIDKVSKDLIHTFDTCVRKIFVNHNIILTDSALTTGSLYPMNPYTWIFDYIGMCSMSGDMLIVPEYRAHLSGLRIWDKIVLSRMRVDGFQNVKSLRLRNICKYVFSGVPSVLAKDVTEQDTMFYSEEVLANFFSMMQLEEDSLEVASVEIVMSTEEELNIEDGKKDITHILQKNFQLEANVGLEIGDESCIVYDPVWTPIIQRSEMMTLLSMMCVNKQFNKMVLTNFRQGLYALDRYGIGEDFPDIDLGFREYYEDGGCAPRNVYNYCAYAMLKIQGDTSEFTLVCGHVRNCSSLETIAIALILGMNCPSPVASCFRGIAMLDKIFVQYMPELARVFARLEFENWEGGWLIKGFSIRIPRISKALFMDYVARHTFFSRSHLMGVRLRVYYT